MGAYRGNRDALEADAEKVVRRLLAAEASVCGIMREYRVAYPTVKRLYHARSTAEQRAAARRCRRRRAAASSGFQKGHRPHNKGKHFDAGGRSHETRFKPGRRVTGGRHNYRPVGTVTVRRDKNSQNRRRWIKVRDDGPPGKRWLPLARYLWLAAGREIPKGRFIVHRDGDTMNDAADLSNYACVGRERNARLQWSRPGHARRKNRTARERIAARRRRAEADLPAVVGCLLKGAKTVREIAAVYGVAAGWLSTVVRAAMTDEQKLALRRLRRARSRRAAAGDGAPAGPAAPPPLAAGWQCHGCGYGPVDPPPAACPKCGGAAWERLTRRAAV